LIEFSTKGEGMKLKGFTSHQIFNFARACVRCSVNSLVRLAVLFFIFNPSLSYAAKITFRQLSTDLQSADLNRKFNAIYMLKNFGAEGAAKTLSADLKLENEMHVKAAILDSLVILKDPDTIPSIEPLLSDPKDFVRQRAAYTIGLIGGSLAEKALLKALISEKNPHVRATAIQGLSFCGSSRSVPLLQQVLKESDPKIRTQAIHALIRIPGKEAEDALKAHQEPNPQLKQQRDDGLKVRTQGAK
jgi:HEAT repeat protein